jgi:hypothetical protein
MNRTFSLGDGLDVSAAWTAVANKVHSHSKPTNLRRNRIAFINWRRCCPAIRVMSSLRPLVLRPLGLSPDLAADQVSRSEQPAWGKEIVRRAACLYAEGAAGRWMATKWKNTGSEISCHQISCLKFPVPALSTSPTPPAWNWDTTSAQASGIAIASTGRVSVPRRPSGRRSTSRPFQLFTPTWSKRPSR